MDDEPSTVGAPAPPDWIRDGWPLVARCVRRLIRDDAWHDVAQDALLEAWRRRAAFDPDRGRADSWMLAIAVSHVRRFHRKHPATQHLPLSEVDCEPARSDHSAGSADRSDLLAAIDLLPERQQLAVTLSYFLDLPEAEVAAVMGCRPGTVKSTLAAARAALHDHLGADYR